MSGIFRFLNPFFGLHLIGRLSIANDSSSEDSSLAKPLSCRTKQKPFFSSRHLAPIVHVRSTDALFQGELPIELLRTSTDQHNAFRGGHLIGRRSRVGNRKFSVPKIAWKAFACWSFENRFRSGRTGSTDPHYRHPKGLVFACSNAAAFLIKFVSQFKELKERSGRLAGGFGH